MKGGTQDNCPLCDNPQAQAIELVELASRRIECPRCTNYEISDGLESILADSPEAKGRAPLLSAAASRATQGVDKRDILTHCLKLSEENFLGIAAKEEAAQQAAH